MNTLLLRLEGPLQSWGLRARWEERDTAFEPTKSGVVGLLGCALGLRRDADQLRPIAEALTMGVRVERAGALLVDYHTTGGGFPGGESLTSGTRYADEPYVGGVLSTERPKDGRYQIKITAATRYPETDVSRRLYVMDACFLVALRGPEPLIADLATAVRNPVWPIFLGRKACVPTAPVYAGVGDFADLHAALTTWPLGERAEAPYRLLLETQIGQGILRNDQIGIPARRMFWPRAVAETVWTPDDAHASINTLEG
jgi:CRISPR system Cascade subunit CasD